MKAVEAIKINSINLSNKSVGLELIFKCLSKCKFELRKLKNNLVEVQSYFLPTGKAQRTQQMGLRAETHVCKEMHNTRRLQKFVNKNK